MYVLGYLNSGITGTGSLRIDWLWKERSNTSVAKFRHLLTTTLSFEWPDLRSRSHLVEQQATDCGTEYSMVLCRMC